MAHALTQLKYYSPDFEAPDRPSASSCAVESSEAPFTYIVLRDAEHLGLPTLVIHISPFRTGRHSIETSNRTFIDRPIAFTIPRSTTARIRTTRMSPYVSSIRIL